MSRPLTFEVDSTGDRLDSFLTRRCPDLSRSRLRSLILDGHVTLDGTPTKPAFRPRPGQLVAVAIPELVPSHLVPQHIPLTVVYEAPDILVVDKPAGLTVHPGPGHRDRTLVNAILAMCPDIQGIGGTVRPGIVHRLDKDTSGLMVVAKTEMAHRELAGQVTARAMAKRYLALVHGQLSPPEAVIEAPIGRDPGNRKRMAVVANGRESTTRYRTLGYRDGFTLAEVETTTGRTHQVRVHLAAVGHPLAGDETYGRRHPRLARHFLHAHRLGFRLPSNEEWMEFKSEPPAELTALLVELGLEW